MSAVRPRSPEPAPGPGTAPGSTGEPMPLVRPEEYPLTGLAVQATALISLLNRAPISAMRVMQHLSVALVPGPGLAPD